MKPVTIDFETEAIEARPDYPPKPVGVAIWTPGRKAKYLAWGHPTGNNCAWVKARDELRGVWYGKREMLFHNAPFDLEVAEVHFGLDYPHWSRVHDTMLLAFLVDPHAKYLALKKLADKWLNMPPEEQDEIRDWVLNNVEGAKKKKAQWGAHIGKAPGSMVSKYAAGDVVRTRKLFDLFSPMVDRHAYDREREVQPILLQADQRGVPVDVDRLEEDVEGFGKTLSNVDTTIRRNLHNNDLDIDSPKQLAVALDKAGYVEEWVLTDKGNRSVSAKALEQCCTNRELVSLMQYRARLKTGLRTFGKGWLSKIHNGRLHTHWSQVVNNEGVKKAGARTGRLSSSPNFQNLPKTRPDSIDGFPALPHPREYFIARPGMVLIGRDYSQQELRILAYFLGGPVAYAYARDPKMDLHTYAKDMLFSKFGRDIARRDVKTLSFGLLYGMGLGVLASSLGMDRETAAEYKKAYIDILPGFRQLQRQIKTDGFIDTWGGRHYEVEPPLTEKRMTRGFGEKEEKEVEVVLQTFEYKLTNYLIQGTAAECTKEAIINTAESNASDFLLSVHDELLLECEEGREMHEMKLLEEAMTDVNFHPIEMRSDGKVSRTNWAEMEPYNANTL